MKTFLEFTRKMVNEAENEPEFIEADDPRHPSHPDFYKHPSTTTVVKKPGGHILHKRATEDGEVETLEGTCSYKKGDHIVLGRHDDNGKLIREKPYAMSHESFGKLYNDHGNADENGIGTAAPKPVEKPMRIATQDMKYKTKYGEYTAKKGQPIVGGYPVNHEVFNDTYHLKKIDEQFNHGINKPMHFIDNDSKKPVSLQRGYVKPKPISTQSKPTIASGSNRQEIERKALEQRAKMEKRGRTYSDDPDSPDFDYH